MARPLVRDIADVFVIETFRMTDPGRVPDVYAWTCSHCGHEERVARPVVHNEPDATSFP